MSCCSVVNHIPHPWLPTTLDHGKPLCRSMDQTPSSCSTSLGEVDLYDIAQDFHLEIEIWLFFC